MSWSTITSGAKSATAVTTLTTDAVDTTGATLIVVGVAQSSTLGTLSDSKSNTWTLIGGVNANQHRLYYCKNPTVGTGHTFTYNIGASRDIYIAFAAFSGDGVIDKQSFAAQANTTTPQPGSITPLLDGELLVAMQFATNGWTASSIDSGFSLLSTAAYAAVAALVQSTAAAINPAFTISGSSGTELTSIVSFALVPTAAVTGTATAGIDEGDIVAGGETLIATLTDGTWASGSTPTLAFNKATTKGTTATAGLQGNGDLTESLPAGWLPGDLALMVVYCDAGSGSVPTNWAEVSGSPWGSGPKLQCFYKILQLGDVNPVTTISGSSGSNSACANVLTYTGSDILAPIGAVGTMSESTGSPMTAAGITVAAGSIVAFLCGRGDNEDAGSQTVNASSTGVAERADGGTSAGNDSQVSVYDKTIAAGGATGDGSSTTSATDPWVSVAIEIKKAPSSPFDQMRRAAIDGIVSAQSETHGWNAERANIPVTAFARTSDTVGTLTLPALAAYDITAQETDTWTVPALVLANNHAAVVGSPTFTIDPAGGGATTLSLATGSLVLSGQALKANRRVALATGATALAGQTLKANPTVALGTGALAADGKALTILFNAVLEIATGALALDGQTLKLNRLVALATGAGLLDGQTLKANRAVALDTGAGVFAGQDLSTLMSATLTLDTGALALTGQELKANLVVDLDTGAAVLTGQDLEILATGTLQLATGTLSLEGQGLKANQVVALDTVALTLDGKTLAIVEGEAGPVAVVRFNSPMVNMGRMAALPR